MIRPCRPSSLALAALLLALSSTGCTIYGGDDDDCLYYADEPGGYGLRNPQTNECETWGGGGGGGCYGDDTPVPAGDQAMALPNWASCPSECEGLDELSCQRTDGCRATYWLDQCPPGVDCDALFVPVYDVCVGVAPGGTQWGSCEGLDAQQCSETDACSAVYTTQQWARLEAAPGSEFSYCQPEPWVEGCYSSDECPAGYECTANTDCYPPPGCGPDGDCDAVCYGQCVPVGSCAAVDCGPGYHCEEQCYPCDDADGDGVCPSWCETICVPDEPQECVDALCGPGTHCETVCTDDCDPNGMCGGWCTSECVPDGMDPGTCTGDVFCDSLPPSCPADSTPGIRNGCWTGYCIPLSACGPSDPGSCYEPALCDVPPPACPVGTTPGVADGCYTGYCIPAWACEGGGGSCESLTTEWECASRFDCWPLYSGTGCTCYPDGRCECLEWEFARCTGGGPTDPPSP